MPATRASAITALTTTTTTAERNIFALREQNSFVLRLFSVPRRIAEGGGDDDANSTATGATAAAAAAATTMLAITAK